MFTVNKVEQYLHRGHAVGCTREQMANFLRVGYVAQPKQLQFHAAAREADLGVVTEIGFGGARGPGKSHALFAQVVLDDAVRAPGIKALYLRRIGKQAREQFENFRRRVLYKTEHKYNRNEGVLYLPNGSLVCVGHFKDEADVDNYLGLEYEVIALEEATSLTHLKYQALRNVNRTARADFTPRIYSSTNPGGIGHTWYKELFITPAREGVEDFTRFVFATVDDNAFLNDGYRNNLERNTGWRLRAFRFGDWDIAAGLFFDNWDESVHVGVVDAQPHWDYWLAMDYGYNHWTVVYLFGAWRGMTYVVDEVAARHKLPNEVAPLVSQMGTRHSVKDTRRLPFVAGSDVFAKREGKSVADKWKEQGYELKPANMDRVNGAAECLQAFGDRSVLVSDRCRRLAKCIPTLLHDPHNPEDVLKVDISEDGTGGDDAYDAFRYGMMFERRKNSPTVGPAIEWRR